MLPEENQNQEKISNEEKPVSAPPKQEVVGSVPVVEEIPVVAEVVADDQITPVENIENQQEEIKIPEVIEPTTETPAVETEETEQDDAGLPRSEELAETTTEEEVQPTPPTQEIEQPQPIQIQEAPTPTQQPQIKTIEKIIYQTPPNFIQNLLNKARAKIQERKRKKLDKIMSLFESNSEISNSDIQKLLRTTKRSATRYLNILEKKQKIIQIGKAGRSVKYTKK